MDSALSNSRQPAVAYSVAAQLALSRARKEILEKMCDTGQSNRMSNIKLSVIVPCYNSRDYIAESLLSVLPFMSNSTELVIVNDGSTDDSSDIIENTVKNYKGKNITVIHQDNGGLSAARNTGINASKGEYISFLDSDDYFDPDFWKEIPPLINDSSIDIIEFNAEQFEGSSSNIVEHIDCSVFQGEVVIQSISDLTPAFKKSKWYPWARVYKATLFRKFNIRFPAGRLYEDMSTIPAMYLHSKVIYGITKSLVWYRYHHKSITQTFRQKDLNDLVYAAQSLSLMAKDDTELKKVLFPTIQRTFNLIKYMLVRNKGVKLPTAEQKALRRALLTFIEHFKTSRQAQILIFPLYLNTIVRFRKK